jgi:hypothetical protein
MAHEHDTGDDLLLRVLSGEAATREIGDEAAQSLTSISRAFLIPALNRSRLIDELRKIDLEEMPRVLVTKSGSRWKYFAAAAAAVMIVAVGIVFLKLRQSADPVSPGIVAPKPEMARQFADGSWRSGDGSSIIKIAEAGRIAAMKDRAILLKEGRADIVTEGGTKEYATVLAALDRKLNVSVKGSARYALRMLPGKPWTVALSVFSGAPESVRLASDDKSVEQLAGANVDAVVTLADANITGAETAVSRWLDTSALIPPVCAGEIFLRLSTDRVLRGIVTKITENGILIRHRGFGSVHGLAAADDEPADITESVLQREISGWVPAETPRGRDIYAAWLRELLPMQLKSITSRWYMYLTMREFDARAMPEREMLRILPVARFPSVEYRVREGDGALFLMARPEAVDLGAGFEMDERGNVREIGAQTPPGVPGF